MLVATRPALNAAPVTQTRRSGIPARRISLRLAPGALMELPLAPAGIGAGARGARLPATHPQLAVEAAESTKAPPVWEARLELLQRQQQPGAAATTVPMAPPPVGTRGGWVSRLAKAAALFGLAVVLALGGGMPAHAARSGGRMGGSSFSASRGASSFSSRSSGGSSFSSSRSGGGSSFGGGSSRSKSSSGGGGGGTGRSTGGSMGGSLFASKASSGTAKSSGGAAKTSSRSSGGGTTTYSYSSTTVLTPGWSYSPSPFTNYWWWSTPASPAPAPAVTAPATVVTAEPNAGAPLPHESCRARLPACQANLHCHLHSPKHQAGSPAPCCSLPLPVAVEEAPSAEAAADQEAFANMVACLVLVYVCWFVLFINNGL